MQQTSRKLFLTVGYAALALVLWLLLLEAMSPQGDIPSVAAAHTSEPSSLQSEESPSPVSFLSSEDDGRSSPEQSRSLVDATSSADMSAQDLPDDAWQRIREQIRQDQYAIQGRAGDAVGYQATNRAHNLDAAFTANGVRVRARTTPAPPPENDMLSGRMLRQLEEEPPAETPWHWELTFAGYGYQGDVQAIDAKPVQSVADNRMAYTYTQRGSRITEWYINGQRGLEHGFTLEAPPARAQRSDAPLILELALDTDLTPYLIDQGQTLLFKNDAGQTILRYAHLHVYDAEGQALSAHFSLFQSPPSISIVVDDAQAVYPLTVDPLLTSQAAKLTAGDGAAEDEFGSAVAVSGEIVVVGAPNDDDNGSNSGAAYVFARNQGGANGWGQVTKLTASDAQAGDNFGDSVSLSGDTLVIGAWWEDSGGSKAGAAYVFERNQGGADSWGQVTKLTASDAQADDWFGLSVSLSGDTLVIGAPDEDSGGDGAGAAYVFSRNQGGADNWGQTAKLTAADGRDWSSFGHAVAVSGETILVGALGDYENGPESGAAYVFARNAGGADNWGQIVKLTAADGGTGDNFGYAVAVSEETIVVGALESDAAYVFARNAGGADNWGQIVKLTAADGADDFGDAVAVSGDIIVVGAPDDDDNGNDSGSAYVFERNQGGADNWGQTHKITVSDGAAGDNFGYAVAVSGNTIVVGAYQDDDNGDASGSAYVFSRTGKEWLQQSKPTASDGATRDRFGRSVDMSGDTVVVGAYGNDDNGDFSGSAYVFSRNQEGADNWGQMAKITAADGAAYDSFGRAVAVSGNTIVVGAYEDDDNSWDSGSAYVFSRNQGGADNWGQTAKLTADDGAAGDYFGLSVDVSGETIVIGAYGDDAYAGAAYVFSRNEGGADNWGQKAKLTAADAAVDDDFGLSVAVSGETIVVGSYKDDDNGSSSGSAYVFSRNQGGADQWGQTAKITADDGASGDNFGCDVAVSGETIVVGALEDDDDGIRSGSAYIFSRNQGGVDNWGQTAKLTADDGAAHAWFGWSVAASRDTGAVVVGAPGSAYVFSRNEGGADNWGQTAKITAADGAAGDGFGLSVAVSGETIVVGAYEDDDNGTDSGAAYVYRRECLIPEIVVAPLGLAFGDQDVDTGATISQTVIITSNGEGDLHITSLALTGGDAAHFQIVSGGDPITLTPGSTHTVQVAFDPAITGSKSAHLTIQSYSDEPTVNVALSGTGIDQEITVAPLSLAFGNQDIYAGATLSQSVTLTNDGSADLHITSTALTGGDAAHFRLVSGGSPITLTPGNTQTVQVAFDPASVGAQSASLTLQSDDSDESTVNVALSGTGTAPDLHIVKTVSSAPAAPGQAQPGQLLTYTLAFSNVGSSLATGVRLTDRVPISLTHGSHHVSNSGAAITSTPGISYAWQVQDLAPGESGIITITGVLSAPLAAGAFTNTAIITGATDVDLANNTSAAAVTVLSPTVAFASATYSTSETAGPATITATLDFAAPMTITVAYSTVNDTAIAGQDYLTTSGVLTFAPGTTVLTFTVPITDDAVDEHTEALDLTLANPQHAYLGADSVTLHINDDDPLPTVAFSHADYSEDEDAATTSITVTLDAPSEKTLTVDYATVEDTARAGYDYLTTTGTLTFTPGTTTLTFTVPITDDLMDEYDKRLDLILANVNHATLGLATATLTLNDNDVPPSLTISDTTVIENSSGTTDAVFTLTLSLASAKPITVTYATADGDAVAGTDYVATSGTLTFAPGVTRRWITVTVTGDTDDEVDETFALNLSMPQNVTLADAQGVATILDKTTPAGDITINGGATYAPTTGVTLTLVATDAHGLDQMQFSNNGADWSAWEPYATTKLWTLTGGDGGKNVYARCRDTAGNTGLYSDAITLDTTPPDSAVTPLPPYQTALTFTVAWSGSDARSGLSSYDVQVKAAGGAWTDWLTETTATSAVFTGTDNVTYTFQSRARDAVGNIEPYPGGDGDAYTTVDVSPPSGTLTINLGPGTAQGAIDTTDTQVTLALAAQDATSGVDQMAVSNDGVNYGAWQAVTAQTAWTLPTGDGPKTVYVQYRDHAGNRATYSDTITLNTSVPGDTGVCINGCTATTPLRDVVLTIKAPAHTAEMKVSNSSNFAGVVWEPYVITKSWTLGCQNTGDTCWVYVKFRDVDGTESTTHLGNIKYEAPTYDLAINKTGPSAALPGDPITYTLTFANQGAIVASGVFITDSLPVGQITQPTYTVSSGVAITHINSAPYVWAVQDLPGGVGAGGIITLTGVLTTPLPAGQVTNVATITTLINESVTANNADAASVWVQNVAPVVGDSVYVIDEDTVLSATIATHDDNGDTLTAAIATPPFTGNAVIPDAQAATWIYTPTNRTTGYTDTFTVMVTDPGGLTDTATLTVTVAADNDAPVAPDASLTTSEDVPLADTLAVTDSDTDDALTVTLATSPSWGTVSVTPDGVWTYTPTNRTASYTDAFTLAVRDRAGLTDTACLTVTVNAVNNAPSAQDASASTHENVPVTGTLAFTDADSDDALTVTLSNSPTWGAARVTPAGASGYTPTNRIASYTDAFTVTIADRAGLTDTARLSLNITADNDPPTVQDVRASTDEDTPVAGTLTITDVDTNDTLTVTLIATPTLGAAHIAPDGAWTYTPTNRTASYTATFEALIADSQPNTATATLTVTVAADNDAPVAPDASLTTGEDVPLADTLAVTDSDTDDALTVTLATSPAWGTVSVTPDGVWTYTPTNRTASYTDAFTLAARDRAGLTDTARLMVTVNAVNNAPSAQDASTSTHENALVTGTLAFTDADSDDAPTVTLSTSPTWGAARVTPGGAWVYTPTNRIASYTDAFTVTIADRAGLTDTARLSLNITADNDPPTVQDVRASTDEDTPVAGTLTITDVDTNDTLTVTLIATPTLGAAHIAPDGAWIYTPTNRTASYTTTFEALIADSQPNTATATLTVTVAADNDAPVAQDDTASTDPYTPITLAPLANDTDPDTDDVLTLVAVAVPSEGEAARQGQTIRYTPTAEIVNPTVTFTYTVSDGVLSDTAQVRVAINRAPIADAGPDRFVTGSQAVQLDGSGSHDPDGHLPLTYRWQQMGGPFVILNDTESAQLAFQAPPFASMLNFTLIVTDAQGVRSLPATANVYVDVTAMQDLTLTHDAPTSLGWATHLTTSVSAGNLVDYEWALGDGRTATGPAVTHIYTAPGTYSATVTARNPLGVLSATLPVRVQHVPLSGVDIVGPAKGLIDTVYTFTAQMRPITPSLPLTVTWQATGQPPRTRALAGARDTLTATWALTGSRAITITARQPGAVVSDTHTFLLNDEPWVGDAYEIDDTCTLASPLPTDGTVQVHTFHDTGDEDWVAFQGTAGVTYTIEAQVPPTSTADLDLVLFDRCGGTGQGGQNFAADVRLTFSAPADGIYYLRIRHHEAQVYGADAAYHLSIRTPDALIPSGAVVIVGGRLREDDELQENIHHVTNAVYAFAQANGCSAEQIYYLATDDSLDADGDGLPDVDNPATEDNLQYVLTQWAASKVGPDRALSIFLMDHGTYDRLYLDEPNGERISPQDIDDWLTQLEQAVPGVPINVVVEACHSGSFIDPVHKVSAGERVVIASTAPYALAHASRRGAAFSDAFLSALSLGKGLRDAFQEGAWTLSTAHPDQVPWLDDTGEGVPNANDGAVAARRGFACGASPVPTRWPPHIAEGEVRPVSGGRGEIWADIWDDGDIHEAWAVVYPPSYRPPEVEGEMIPEPLPVTLHSQEETWYGGLYGALDEVGRYRVVLNATDTEGLLARPHEVLVSVGGESVEPDSGLRLEIPVGGLTTTVDVPAGVVTATTTFTHAGFTDLGDSPELSGFNFAGRRFTLDAYQYGALRPHFTFSRPITITVRYSDADVDELDESTLALFYRDGDAWRQDSLAIIDHLTATHTLTVVTMHLSEFALFAKPAPTIAGTFLEIPIDSYTTTVDIPTTALDAPTTFTYTAFTDLSGFGNLTGLDDDYEFAGRGFDLTAYQGGVIQSDFIFEHPITIAMGYSSADAKNLDEGSLALFYRDGDAWRTDGLTVTRRLTETNEVVVRAGHLTEFGLFGQERGYRVYLPLVLK